MAADTTEMPVEQGGAPTREAQLDWEQRTGRLAASAHPDAVDPGRAIDGMWVAAGDEIATWVEGLDLPSVRHGPPRGV